LIDIIDLIDCSPHFNSYCLANHEHSSLPHAYESVGLCSASQVASTSSGHHQWNLVICKSYFPRISKTSTVNSTMALRGSHENVSIDQKEEIAPSAIQVYASLRKCSPRHHNTIQGNSTGIGSRNHHFARWDQHAPCIQ